MTTLDDLRALGYEIENASPDTDTYAVRGPGLSTYVEPDDAEAFASFAATHDERLFQTTLDSDELNAWVRLTMDESVAVEPPPSSEPEDRPLVNGERVDAAELPQLMTDLLA